MSKKIVFVSGDKGGVGKSTVSNGLINLIENTLAIDGDSRNPDVARIKRETEPRMFDLRTSKGWYELLNNLQTVTQDWVIVSLPAGVGQVFEKEFQSFVSEAKGIDFEVILLWVSSRQRESIELLNRVFDDCCGDIRVINVLNGFFGGREDFSLWDGSKLRAKFIEKGGQEVYWPGLFDVVADKLSTYSMTFSQALISEKFMLGDRSNLRRYMTEIEENVLPVLVTK